MFEDGTDRRYLVVRNDEEQYSVWPEDRPVPFLVFGLLAGAWVDRHRRRHVLILADAGRALALGTIPAAYALGVLDLALLYPVAFVTGTLTVFFDVAHQSYLPSLVRPDQL